MHRPRAASSHFGARSDIRTCPRHHTHCTHFSYSFIGPLMTTTGCVLSISQRPQIIGWTSMPHRGMKMGDLRHLLQQPLGSCTHNNAGVCWATAQRKEANRKSLLFLWLLSRLGWFNMLLWVYIGSISSCFYLVVTVNEDTCSSGAHWNPCSGRPPGRLGILEIGPVGYTTNQWVSEVCCAQSLG